MPKSKPKTSPSANSGLDQEDVDDFLRELEDEPGSTQTDGGESADAAVDETEAEPALHQPEEESEGVTARVVDRGHQRPTKVPVTIEAAGSAAASAPPPPKKKAPPAPAMGKFERSKKRGFPWGWTIAIVTVLAVAALTGFFVFNRAQRFSGNGVKLNIDAPATIASGSDITISIRYFNDEPVNLVQAELNVEYPDGFTVTETSLPATNDFKNSFNLGTVNRGRAGTVTITGQLLGQVDTSFEFSALLSYRPANFNSEFQARDTASVKITSSLLAVTLEGPTRLGPNVEGTWTITYANSADRDLENVRIETVLPESFSLTKADPTATERDSVWLLDRVERGREGKISLTGTLDGSVGESGELIVRAGLVEQNQTKLQTEQRLLIFIVSSGVTVSLAVNGQAEDSSVEAGDDLSYTLKVANQSDLELADVTVTVDLAGRGYSADSLSAQTKGAVAGSKVTWTKSDVIGLALLKPATDIQFRFNAETIASLAAESDEQINPTVTATVTINSPSLPAGDQAPKPTVFVTKVATQLRLTTEARYADDDGSTVGSGPIPPVVGQTTSYRIRWHLANTTSEISDLKVVTTLPTHVLWTGRNVSRDAGDIAFDSATRTVTWTINKVPAGTGTRLPRLDAEFEVSITPTADQAGSVVVLTETTTASGTDAFTTKSREVKQSSLTSDLTTDPTYTGNGTVQLSPSS